MTIAAYILIVTLELAGTENVFEAAATPSMQHPVGWLLFASNFESPASNGKLAQVGVADVLNRIVLSSCVPGVWSIRKLPMPMASASRATEFGFVTVQLVTS